MAITQTGSVSYFHTGTTTNTGTASSTITVPSDAQLVIACLSSFDGVAAYYSTGSVTFTKGGTDTAMSLGIAGDDDTGVWMSSLWYLVAPDTGSNKSLKWDWSGSGSSDDNTTLAISFWKGIDTASPVRDADRGHGASAPPYTTPTLTAQSGDLIVAFAAAFSSGSNGNASWTNATALD